MNAIILLVLTIVILISAISVYIGTGTNNTLGIQIGSRQVINIASTFEGDTPTSRKITSRNVNGNIDVLYSMKHGQTGTTRPGMIEKNLHYNGKVYTWWHADPSRCNSVIFKSYYRDTMNFTLSELNDIVKECIKLSKDVVDCSSTSVTIPLQVGTLSQGCVQVGEYFSCGGALVKASSGSLTHVGVMIEGGINWETITSSNLDASVTDVPDSDFNIPSECTSRRRLKDSEYERIRSPWNSQIIKNVMKKSGRKLSQYYTDNGLFSCPGTNWCGPGDLHTDNVPPAHCNDAACRRHDHCDNRGQQGHTSSTLLCGCDKRIYDSSSSGVHWLSNAAIGVTFYKYTPWPCLGRDSVCTSRNWWGSCRSTSYRWGHRYWNKYAGENQEYYLNDPQGISASSKGSDQGHCSQQ